MEKIDETKNRPRNNSRLILGILLLLFGFLILGRHLHVFPFHTFHFLFSWKMILVGLGLFFVLTDHSKTLGTILLIVGGIFLLDDIYGFSFPVGRLIFPAILIAVGILVIVRSTGKGLPQFQKASAGDDYIDDVAVFGGGKIKLLSKEFKGGKITSIFGGSDIDLGQCELAGGTQVIDVFALFGGSKFYIPAHWKVRTEVIALFGGFSDKRRNLKEPGSDNTLLIKGIVIFGGGDIKDA